MKSYEESAQEYQEFVVKISKAGKDFCDAVNSLSPENLKVFKREMRNLSQPVAKEFADRLADNMPR